MQIRRSGAKRAIAALALTGAAALALAGCTTGSGDTDSSSTGKNVTIAVVNEATSFNSNTEQGNLDTNGMLEYMTHPAFFTLGDDYSIIHNSDLGSYKKTSDDPLTVEYTLNKDAKWSDGSAMTADDLLLGWAVGSCYFNDSTVDPDSGEVTGGTQYFATAGGCPYATERPKVSNDNRTITFSYTQSYVDWELVNPIQFPLAGLSKMAGVSEKDALNALKTQDKGDPSNPATPNDTLVKLGKAYSTGFDATSLPKDKNVLVSGGPLEVSAWTPKQSMTLVPNPEYTGKKKVQFSKLIIRFIGDANAQVTALANGEVDAIQPQASADTVKALDAAKGVKVLQGNQVAYDHLDLNFRANSSMSDPTVREAFLLTIPRDDILNAIVTPINKDAKVLNSQIFLPGQDGYSESVDKNGSSAYSKVDIDKAKQLLAGRTPTVRILYNTGNPNRVDSFQAIQASAAKAGFNIVDAGSPDWSSLLAGGDYDASIFGWINPGAGNAAIPQLFQIGNSGNYTAYNDKEASELAVKTQSTLDADELLKQKEQIDALAFKDAYGLPLFQLPGIFATNSSLKGVKYFGGQTGIVWNIWDWTK